MTGLKRTLRSRRGFTLVELVVVLVIAGITASFAVPALTGYIDNAKEKQAVSETQACVETVTRIAAQKYAEWQKNTTYQLAGGKELTSSSEFQPLVGCTGTTSNTPPTVTGGDVALTEGSGQYLLHVSKYEPGGFPATGSTADISAAASVTGTINTLTCSSSGQVVYLVYTSKDGITVVYTNNGRSSTVSTKADAVVVPPPEPGSSGGGTTGGGETGGGGTTGGGETGDTTPPKLPDGALGFATFYYYDIDGVTPIKDISVSLYFKDTDKSIGTFTTDKYGAIYVPVFPSPQEESQRRTDRVEGFANNFYRLKPSTITGRQEMFFTDFQVAQNDYATPTAFTLTVPTDANNSYNYRAGELNQATNSYKIYNAAVPRIKIRITDENDKDVNNIEVTLYRGADSSGEQQLQYTTLGVAKEVYVQLHSGDNISQGQPSVWGNDNCYLNFVYDTNAYSNLNSFPIRIYKDNNTIKVESYYSNNTSWEWNSNTMTLTIKCKRLSQSAVVPSTNLNIEFVDAANTTTKIIGGHYELRPYNIYYSAQASFDNATGTNIVPVSTVISTGKLLTKQYYLLVETESIRGYNSIPTVGFMVQLQSDGETFKFENTTDNSGVKFDQSTLTITILLNKPTATPEPTPKPSTSEKPDSFNGIVEIKAYVDGNTNAPTFKLYNYNNDGTYNVFTNLNTPTYSGTYPYTFTTPLYLGDSENKNSNSPMIELGKTYLLAENKMPGKNEYLEQAAYLFRYEKDSEGNLRMLYKRPSEPESDWKVSDTLTLSFANVKELPVNGKKHDVIIKLAQGGKAAIWPADDQQYIGENKSISAPKEGNIYEYQGIYYVCSKKGVSSLNSTDQPMNFTPGSGKNLEMIPLSITDFYAQDAPKNGNYTIGDMYYAENTKTKKKYIYLCRKETNTLPLNSESNEYWYMWSEDIGKNNSFVKVTSK